MSNSTPEYVKNAKKNYSEIKKTGQKPKTYSLIKTDTDKSKGEAKGNPTAVCSSCKSVFQQDFSPEMNAYSSFKICPECRAKLDKEKKAKIQKSKEKEVSTVTLPFEPWPWQQKAFEDFQTHRFNLWACGNRCLLEGEFIQGCNKPIEELQAGDIVFGRHGNEQKVLDCSFNYYYGDAYTIRACGCLPFRCNDEHKIYVCKINKRTKRVMNEQFVMAKDLQEHMKDADLKNIGYYLKMPKIQKEVVCNEWVLEDGRSFPINEDTAWILGLYCAEGCCIANSLKWTLNYKEPELADRVIETLENLGYHTSKRERPEEGTRCVLAYKRILVKRIDAEIGHGSRKKHIPDSILYNKDKNILIAFLQGYYAGDGYFDKLREAITASSVSSWLMRDLQTAWHILGYFANINYSVRKKTGTTEYRIQNVDPECAKLLGIDTNRTNANHTAIKIGDCFYTPIRKITVENVDCKLYQIKTEDGTFVHNNQINSNCGKDFSANMIGIWYFVQCLNENRAVKHPEMAPSVLWWIIAPTEPMAKQNWRDLKQQFPKAWVVACSDSNMTMQTVGGGIIEVRSAYNPESLVGVGLDLVTITEAARINDLEVVWANLEARLGSPGRGLEKDRQGRRYGQGKCIINSTPIGKNYFYTMWKWGQPTSTEYSSEWVSYQLPWTENYANRELADTIVKTKYGEMRYEDDLRRRLGDRLFRQNYLADFLAGDGKVFKDFEENCVTNVFSTEYHFTKQERDNFIREWREPKPFHQYRIGYDPATGSSSDSPIIVVRDMNENKIVYREDLYGKNYDQQWDEIGFVSRRYNYAPCVWLRTGHTAVENQLAKRGVVEIPLDEQAGKKAQYIQSLERAIQNKEVRILMDGTTEAQTHIMQMIDYTEKDGRYSNEQQPHDDYVSATYAVYYDYSEESNAMFYCGLMGSVRR